MRENLGKTLSVLMAALMIVAFMPLLGAGAGTAYGTDTYTPTVIPWEHASDYIENLPATNFEVTDNSSEIIKINGVSYRGRVYKITAPADGMYIAAKQRYGFTSNIVENVPDSVAVMGASQEDVAKFRKLYEDVRQGKEFATADVWFNSPVIKDTRCERLTYYTVKDISGKPVKAYGIGMLHIQSGALVNFEVVRHQNDA